MAASETDDNAQLHESRVKELTGGDIISARRMCEDFWDFVPTHKIILLTNHKPKVQGSDHGIWRRLKLIPFLRRFWSRSKGEMGPVELEADPQLAEKLKTEYPGILAWLIEGCLAWQRNGLGVPPEVIAATEQYRESEDSLAGFLKDCCTVQPDAAAGVGVLLEAFQRHSGDEITQRHFTRLLTKRGFLKRRATSGTAKGQWQWQGIGLTECQVSGSVSNVEVLPYTKSVCA